jgi:predicted ribosomally synthesized peptide with SipW-like signal peptide
MQKRNKAIVAGLSVSAVAAAVALTGSTSAYYYDLETSENKIKACGFDLQYDAEVDPAEDNYGSAMVTEGGSVVIKNVAPGDSFAVTVTLANVGACEGDLWAQVNDVRNQENGVTEPERTSGDDATDGELGDHVTISVPELGVGGVTMNTVPWHLLSGATKLGTMPADFGPVSATINIDVPKGGGAGDVNDIMTDSFELDFDLALVQRDEAPGPELS